MGTRTEPPARAPFEAAWLEHRAFTLDLAFRMLGDIGEAEDVVQEAFARLLRADVTTLGDVRGWLVVVVSRLCLDVLRSARVRRSGDPLPTERDALAQVPGPDPADRVTLDESVRTALLVVLEQLTPAERTVFVLHDVFGYPFETVASIVGRSRAACRQLASRSRQRIEAEATPARFQVEPTEHRELTERFLAACAGGDLRALTALLDPEVVGGIDMDVDGRPQVLHGSEAVARTMLRFLGPESATTIVSNPLATRPGLLVFGGRTLLVAMNFETTDGRISHCEATRDPDKIALLRRQLGLHR